MNPTFTKSVMTLNALFLFIIGALAVFNPFEIVSSTVQINHPSILMFIQISGALYVGFGFVNWLAKSLPIGGIYARPLCIGNFYHYFIATFSILKYSYSGKESINFMWPLFLTFLAFTILFGYLLFGNLFKVNKI
jgi:hypothetical protein